MTTQPLPPPIQNYRPAQQPASFNPAVVVLAIVSVVSILCNVLLLGLWVGSSPAKVVLPERVEIPTEPSRQAATKPKMTVNELLKQQNDEMVKHLTLESSRAEDRRVQGTVVNNGKKTGYIFVHFNLYDETGTKTKTISAHIQSLDAGERWNFKTTASDFASFKFSHFTAQPPR